MQKKLFLCAISVYNIPMFDTKTDYDKFTTERNAATDLRMKLAYASGVARVVDPELADMIDEALKKHREEREENWF
jgi:hypothetical protein